MANPSTDFAQSFITNWVATVALGVLARSCGEECGKTNAANPKFSLQAFWAPFILWHLGGPDTITAYSLEDNELWLRHLLGLVFEVGVAIYVFFRSLVDGQTTVSFIAIPVFIARITKYGERTWVLSNLKVLFAGLILPHEAGKGSHEIFQSLKSSEAFKLVEYELGLLYDVLYTKAKIAFSAPGIFLRCISSLTSVSALVAFSIISHEQYPSVDISITYLLLLGAVVLGVYQLVMVTSSHWTIDCFCRKKKSFSLEKTTDTDHRLIPESSLARWCPQTTDTDHRLIPESSLARWCPGRSLSPVPPELLIGVTTGLTNYHEFFQRALSSLARTLSNFPGGHSS
ncbi:hypothetical protein PTKIN_Ptkin07bG0060400 [Pterospermum kingtungense]